MDFKFNPFTENLCLTETTRVTALENTYVRSQWFKQIGSGTSGALVAATEVGTSAEFVSDQWPDDVDMLVSVVTSGEKPDRFPPRDASGDPVSATFNTSTGAWALSGTPNAYPIALIYCYRQKLVNFTDVKSLVDFSYELPTDVGLIVREASGGVIANHVNTIKIPDATLTDNGDNSASIVIPHNVTTGLTAPADDHTQYFLLAGRSGGQLGIGGTGTGENLRFCSNSSNDGLIILGGSVVGLVFNEDDEAATIGGGEIVHTINGVNEKSLFEFHKDGNTAPGGITFHRHSNNAALSGELVFLRSRGDHATPLIVQDGNSLGGLRATGFDGTDEAEAAEIDFEVDGTPGNDDMPGRIVFKTSAGGTQTPIERMRISSSGNVDITSTLTINTLLLATGSITDSTGAISFGNENLTTTGTINIAADSKRLTLGALGGADSYIQWNGFNQNFYASSGFDFTSARSGGPFGLRLIKNSFSIANNSDIGILGATKGLANTLAVGGWFATQYPSSTNSATSIYGLNSFAYVTGSGNFTRTSLDGVVGGLYEVRHQGLGTISRASSVESRGQMTAAGTITHYAGFHQKNFSKSAGTLTNLYGIDIDNLTAGINNWSIRTGTAQSEFGGKVGIGATPSVEMLEVTGNVMTTVDSNKYYAGAGKDMAIYYDGADGYIVTDLVAASDLNIDCGTNKTIELQETVWNDIQFQVSSGKVGAANNPRWVTLTTNTSEYAFDINDYIDLASNELVHSWKEGTTGHFHTHVSLEVAQSTGADRFAKFTIYIARPDGSIIWTETTLSAELTIPTGSAALKHFYLDLGDQSLSGLTVGTQIKVRIERITATGGTEYADGVFIHQVGCHVEGDTMGSRQEGAK